MLLGLPTLVGEILVGVALGPLPQHVDHAVLLEEGEPLLSTHTSLPAVRVCVLRAPRNSSAAPCACMHARVCPALVARARLIVDATTRRAQARLAVW